MPFDCPVLVVGDGVPVFKVEHVGAALMARGVNGYWLVEVEPRPRPAGSGTLAQALVGFPGLRIERIASLMISRVAARRRMRVTTLLVKFPVW